MASAWTRLGTPRAELVLSNTLVTGQSFRWRQTGSCYTGVIGQRVVQLRQLPDDVEYRVVARGPQAACSPQADDAAALSDYLQLQRSLQQLCREWSARDERFARLSPFLPGCRMLRQDPVECLFQFICSSNNHISRIHGMVERLCSTYGTQLLAGSDTPEQQQQQQQLEGDSAALEPSQQPQQPQQQQQQPFYAFPTLEQLSAASEEALRADGFGYRAKFIVGSVRELLAKPGGGAAWLLSLRDKPYAEAHEELCTLPGIGPKVASCICLFSLDKAGAIPVDTHVWTLATRHYAPQLAGKSLTPKLHGTVQQVFVDRFGPFAGWAHNTLFISQLASHKQLLPAGLAGSAAAGSKKAGKRGRSKVAAAGDDGSSSGGEADDGAGSQAGSHVGSADMGAADASVTAVLGGAEDRGSSVKQQAARTAVAAASGEGGEAAAGGSRRRSSRARKRSSRYAAAAGSDSDDEGPDAAAGAGLAAAFDAAAAAGSGA